MSKTIDFRFTKTHEISSFPAPLLCSDTVYWPPLILEIGEDALSYSLSSYLIPLGIFPFLTLFYLDHKAEIWIIQPILVFVYPLPEDIDLRLAALRGCAARASRSMSCRENFPQTRRLFSSFLTYPRWTTRNLRLNSLPSHSVKALELHRLIS